MWPPCFDTDFLCFDSVLSLFWLRPSMFRVEWDFPISRVSPSQFFGSVLLIFWVRPSQFFRAVFPTLLVQSFSFLKPGLLIFWVSPSHLSKSVLPIFQVRPSHFFWVSPSHFLKTVIFFIFYLIFWASPFHYFFRERQSLPFLGSPLHFFHSVFPFFWVSGLPTFSSQTFPFF